jgi:hypothetical protein
VTKNAIDIELCMRLTNGEPARQKMKHGGPAPARPNGLNRAGGPACPPSGGVGPAGSHIVVGYVYAKSSISSSSRSKPCSLAIESPHL